ncbi:sugar phosphate isomerase/epimerase family protein [Rubinisphaera brasiliensis]|uniref:Xylose isomerase domain-containing protein TIM barrel n=1 Tax=Rubinisphaera brasiliensis (strain ATCC 49424 / DSM 5305 / JCM 21570 / IAM 15109 / NBRC 103401 / IFAM 1448) TaxID=756272 RepID=F0SLF1_RUBBR|nr:sugar phosphate isomerase/epimerase family protein [Rubinisphaera brasiliensis]ADY62057.1 Xylose isomerase domain-containing protein TIM barrel [Rubinisphaera brasiliensis DSM 5305]
MTISRRRFLQASSAAFASLSLAQFPTLTLAKVNPEDYPVSLAQWSLHRTIRSGKLDNLDFAKTAKEEFGISGLEYVNQFFKDKAKDKKYLGEMKQRANDHGVKSLLIMIDGEGRLGDPNDAKRKQAVENHHKWVEAAKFLGCHSIRVNAASGGTYEEQIKLAADGLQQLTEFAAPMGINVIVENHGGLSSNGEWLASVIKKVDHKNCGTLPDFGNFAINRNEGEWYDRYKGVKELMPYAKAVSFKTHDFVDDRPFVTVDNRWDKETDIVKMMQIVVDAGYKGYIGIEYEGHELDEYAGIRRSKEMLDQTLAKLS